MSDENREPCANGKPGYDIDTGKAYKLAHPCPNPARPGHIYCDHCRKESGGLVK